MASIQKQFFVGLFIISDNHSTLAGGYCFGCLKAKTINMAECSAIPAVIFGEKSLRTILKNQYSFAICQFRYLVHIAYVAVGVNWNDSLGLGRYPPLNFIRCDTPGMWVDFSENGSGLHV